MAKKIQLRRDTAANWASVNPILAQGQEGLELDTGKVKVGDGVTAWNARPYDTRGITPGAIGAATAAQGAKADSAVQPSGLTKAAVGLSNVDDTSDANKPISTATAAALSGKVDTSDSRLSDSRTPTAHKTSHATGGTDALSPGDIGAATAAQGAKADTAIQPDNAALSDAREWSAETISQAEAEAGLSTTRRAFTAQRVFQAVAAWWAGSASKTKLDGIANGATANSSDAQLRDRSTHTGTQPASTITGLSTVATTGAYGDLSGRPTLGTAAAANTGTSAGNVVVLDGAGLIPSAVLPGFVDDVLEFASLATFPATGETGKIYVALNTNRTYRWSGSAYVDIASSPGSTDAVTEGSVNLYFTTARARGAISAGGSLSYNPTTGVVSYTAPTAFTSSTAGLVPASGGGTSNFLRADGTFAAPSSAPAGSSGQIQWNNGGSAAGLSTSSIDGSGNLTFSARWIVSTNGAASAPPVAITGTWFTGGTSTTTKPQLLIEPAGTASTSWSTSGTGLGVNAPSGFAGNLLDLQLTGASTFNVRRPVNYTGFVIANESFDIAAYMQFNGAFCVNADTAFAWNSTGSSGRSLASNTPDLFVRRDAANTLAQRNGTNAQTFRVYNTFTSATNYELGKLEWSSNVFRIGTEKGSAGGTARAMELQTDGTTRLTLAADGSTITAASGTNLVANHRLTGTSPASATATGTTGDIRSDADYIYICTATNTWKRAVIATW